MDRNKSLYDIAIIGGGLAGLTLAIQSANAGFSVILFEKESYPFHKVCGEYISMESHGFLEQLGLDLQNLQLPNINTLQISDVKGRLAKFGLPLGGFGISRFTLDNELYRLALNKGVKIFTETKVLDITFEADCFSIYTADDLFSSKIAVGSFGKKSNLDVKWNRSFTKHKPDKLNNYIGVKYHIQYNAPENLISLHNFKNGYCGISKIDHNRFCLCYLTNAENLQKNGKSVKQMEQAILYKNPHLKQIFETAEFLYKEPLVISQISFHKKSQIENHVILIGDTAGVITPLCGNGMSMAMHSGKIAFEHIRLFLSGITTRETLEKNYTAQWKKTFKTRLFTGRLVQSFFGSNTGTTIFLQIMKTMPFFAKKIINATHGKPF